MDLRELFDNIDSRITSDPGSTAEGLAQELDATVQDIEKAVREVDGVSFNEYRENKRLAHALEALERKRAPTGGKIYQEERAQPRLTMTGTTVRYILQGDDTHKTEYSNPYPIVDLSTGGMAFLADRPAKPGRKVLLLVDSPRRKSLRLEGRVAYAVAIDMAGYRYRLGIRLEEFAANRP